MKGHKQDSQNQLMSPMPEVNHDGQTVAQGYTCVDSYLSPELI
jgi:hypothetical protein